MLEPCQSYARATPELRSWSYARATQSYAFMAWSYAELRNHGSELRQSYAELRGSAALGHSRATLELRQSYAPLGPEFQPGKKRGPAWPNP